MKDDLSVGELKVDSMIRADKIYTLSQEIILKRFGTVKGYILEKVQNHIRKLIDNKITHTKMGLILIIKYWIFAQTASNTVSRSRRD